MSINENFIKISASILIEFNYCKRFIYFMKVLNIPQREEKRYKVEKGRNIHKFKKLQSEYLRKKFHVVDVKRDMYLGSEKFGICGIVDEILFFDDETMGILDYKFAERKQKYRTQFLQSVFYSILVEENFGKKVNKGIIIYTRDKNKVVINEINDKDKEKVKEQIKEIKDIISYGIFPKKTRYGRRCHDCTYKNFCVQ